MYDEHCISHASTTTACPLQWCIAHRYTLTANNVGTYWLHSHYGFQHELGLAIPVVIDGPMPPLYPFSKQINDLTDAVMFLEDYCAYAQDDPDGNRDCQHPADVYDALLEAWKEEEGAFNFTGTLTFTLPFTIPFRPPTEN